MNILFIHQAFPAQFGRLAQELAERHGWKCRFLIESYSACPSPTAEMLAATERHAIPRSAATGTGRQVPWPQVFGRWLELCRAVHDGVKALPGPPPDLIVAHGGQGAPTAFLPGVVGCPIMNYCEYYFPTRFADLTYRVDLPPAEPAPFYPRCINAPTLLGLLACDAGYSATEYQRRSFPARFLPKIEVQFDGIETQLYRPRPELRTRPMAIGGRSVPPGTKVVTYVARGLESMRGFDLFLEVAARVARERPDVLFVVAGSEETYYGWDRLHTGAPTFKGWALERTTIDPGRMVFLGHVEPSTLAEVLARSDLHIYLSVPFVLSWSLINALSCGCAVLGSDVDSVREVIEPGRTGLLAPLFDADALAASALRVLGDPSGHAPLGRAARALIEEKYSLEVCVPRLKALFERAATLPVGAR